MSDKPQVSKVEKIKESSQGLRGTLAEELTNGAPNFETDSLQLLKFHGIYQQDDRDARNRSGSGMEKAYSMMIRGRIPGGRMTAQQYLDFDRFADLYGNGGLRLTTRQSIQYHGVLKQKMKDLIKGIHESMLSTICACGDVVRNVTQAPNPLGDPELAKLDEPSDLISDHFAARSNAYVEIWLDGERVDPQSEEEDPIYGANYLPRKFKIAVTRAGDNSVDLFTNDLALAATFENGEITGYHYYVGGGLGKNHRNAKTYPRLASHLGWSSADQMIQVCEGVIAVQKEFGDRKDRKHARLKYLLEDRGLDWFRSEVEKRTGFSLDQKDEPAWNFVDYLGWHERSDGSLSFGLHILSGRIIDRENEPVKSAIREAVETFKPEVQITPDQDLVFMGLPSDAREKFESIFLEKNLAISPKGSVYSRALACPALPTCGLALAEAERFLPDLLSDIQSSLDKHGLSDRPPVIRMTGCPNGCARPYSAELAFVGRSAGIYAVYVGGNPEGTRLVQEISDTVAVDRLSGLVDEMFTLWKKDGKEGESFGDFSDRIGLEPFKALIAE